MEEVVGTCFLCGGGGGGE
ncbi:hypothetical protein F383_20255 [Gossypium arboreum]|uniref:Uncharacterized protein n=1 Tax=Gossypium arboreum TaxID=29729 RepID=A0A0B0NS14_GOSAR|nr:hypothetical protein F383_20255 [Gossypium arboreum]